MEFTFGIITSGTADDNIIKMISSIHQQQIENYEIIIVGNSNIKDTTVTIVPFDETIKPAWITKKKNIICEMAKYENIVLLHDYIVLKDDWYEGFKRYGNNFLITCNKIENLDQSRFRDYTFFPHNLSFDLQCCLIPYDVLPDITVNKFRYISGSYYVIKKSLALQYPLDENRVACQGEDVELCVRLTNNNVLLDFNPYSSVQFLKYKPPVYWERELTKEEYEQVKVKMLDPSTVRYTIEGIVPIN